jgi:hypothetical protein
MNGPGFKTTNNEMKKVQKEHFFDKFVVSGFVSTKKM